MTRPNVLVLRALGLGDFFTGLPALRMLRDALPEHRIVLAAHRQFAPLARLSGTVDDVVHAHELMPISRPPYQPALSVDLHGNGPASRRLLGACSPRRLIAFGPGGPQWRFEEHDATRWCRLVAEGLPVPDARYPGVAGQLPEPPGVDVAEGVTILHCGAKSASRRWPSERFAALAILLRARGHHVVVTGGGREAPMAHAIAAAANVEAATSLGLPELLALVSRARVVVCGDTGVAHVASNYRTPSVVLFGPVAPSRWGPPPDPRHQVIWHGDGTGDPHGDEPDRALLAVRVAEVAAAVTRALEGARVRAEPVSAASRVPVAS